MPSSDPSTAPTPPPADAGATRAGSPGGPRRGPARPLAIVAALVGAAAILLFLALPLVRTATEDRSDLVTTNSKVDVSQSGTVLEPGDRTCARGLRLPEGRFDLRLYPGFVAKTSPRLRVVVQDAAGRRLQGRDVATYPTNFPIAVPVRFPRDEPGGAVCVENAGRDDVSLAHADDPRPDGGRQPIRVDVWTPVAATADSIPVALTRAGLFKGGLVGRVTIVALMALTLLLAGVAAVLVVRRADEPEDRA